VHIGSEARHTGHILPERPRVAIISTYDELCGIAGYTKALAHQLQDSMDVQVFDLDQYLLRSPHRRVVRLGDRHILDIAKKLKNFDSVNIQLEHGTLGLTMPQILRRFRWLVRSAPAVSVTFHTILDEAWMPLGRIWQQLRQLKLGAAVATLAENGRSVLLANGVYRELRRQQSRKPVHVITHTRRDMRLLRDVHRLSDVHHHPLSFVPAATAAAIRAAATRDAFPILRLLPPGAKLIGTFGFLSPYKGFETAVEALRYLPEDHHLLVFGGIHPQAIARGQPRDAYISKLLDKGHIGQSPLEALHAGGATNLTVDGSARDLLAPHPQDLHHRLHFMGVLDDSQFMSAMALCDSVVLPYLEVGQSSSGPIAMALEMGCRVIASRTRAFLQFARYHPGRVEFFDIGNFAELARRIEAGPPPAAADRPPAYDTTTNAALYLKVSLPPGMAPPAARTEAAEIRQPMPVAVG
jgi:glycosyltransferase involved in cell wall biosynthesis